MENIAIVYMTAGLSSRFGGKIKQFAKVGPKGETLIEYSLKQAIPAGFTKIVFIVGEKTKEPFKKMFGNNYKGIPVDYAFQEYDILSRDKPWGTAESLCSAKEILQCPFVVCNGDDIYGEETFRILVAHLKNKTTNATIGYKLGKVLSEKGNVNRGVFETDSNIIKSIKEFFDINKNNLKTKGLSDDSLCSMNIFALFPEALKLLDEILADFKNKHKDNRIIECLLPVEISRLIENKKLIMEIYPTNEEWLGVTNPDDEIIIKNKLIKK